MRALVFLSLLVVSGTSAQSGGLSLGMGPATAMSGSASYTELRGRIPLTPLLAIEPTLGFGVEAGVPVERASCDEVGRCRAASTTWYGGASSGLGLGAALTIRVPEAALPQPLASAHVGLLGQWEESSYNSDGLRYGVEIGADVRVTDGFRVGAMLQASVRTGEPRSYACGSELEPAACRVSFAPMLRLGYTPEARDHPASGETRRARFSVASGVASGFAGGAVQSEIRLSLPVGRVLAFEPALAYTAAGAYDTFPSCRPEARCAPIRNEGADALSIGVGISAHSGRFRAAGVPLADAYVGTAAYVVSPPGNREDESRLALLAGVAVPLARGLAAGVEFQATAYGGASFINSAREREVVSFAPMLRLTAGG